MSWASKRKTMYLSVTFLLFAIPASIAAALWWYEAPTCFDGLLNQTETAIDKGGPCELLDERALIPHAVLWSRPFMVRQGLFNAVAYIENPNQDAGVAWVSYRMRLYDEGNVLVAQRDGGTYIMPGAITPVFEGAIDTGSRVAVRAFFEFTEPLVWKRFNGVSHTVPVSGKLLTQADTIPRLSARVQNSEPRDREKVPLVAVVFDSAGNAFNTSQTVIPLLVGKGTVEVSFTWPVPFTREAARIDILPLVPPEPFSR